MKKEDLTEPYSGHGKPQWVSKDVALEAAQRMNAALIHNWNSRVKPEDTVYHLGDFCTKGNANAVPGLRTKAESYEAQLNGKIIHIVGNHDRNNGVKGAAIDWAVMQIARWKFLLIHRPPSLFTEGMMIPDGVSAILCGHVHEKWAHMWWDNVVMINVGVDVRLFRPVTKQEVIATYTRLVRERKR